MSVHRSATSASRADHKAYLSLLADMDDRTPDLTLTPPMQRRPVSPELERDTLPSPLHHDFGTSSHQSNQDNLRPFSDFEHSSISPPPAIGDEERSAVSTRASYIPHPDADGLQPSPRMFGSHNSNRDSEGLQTVWGYSPQPSADIHDGKEPTEWRKQQELENDPTAAPVPGAPIRRRRRWWAIGAAIFIAVILISVLGGVLGSRATRKSAVSDPPPQPATTTQAAPAPAGQMKSTSGTWNGTGLTVFYDPTDIRSGFLSFQDFAGIIHHIKFTLDSSTWKMSLGAQSTIQINGTSNNLDAVNGTALSAASWYVDPTDTTSYINQLVYVNKAGTLADVWQTADRWRPGNLTKQNIQAPTDGRLAMKLVNEATGGINSSYPSAKLFAGGKDGKLHQYAFDYTTRSWASPSDGLTFSDSWAYGGVDYFDQLARPDLHDDDEDEMDHNFGTLLFSTDQTGKIQGRIQQNKENTRVSDWPTGGQWNSLLALPNPKAAPNSSVAAVFDVTTGPNVAGAWLIFPDTNGKLSSQSVNASMDATYITWGRSNATLSTLDVIQGTDLAYFEIDDRSDSRPLDYYTTVFYQSNGTTISWIVLDGSGQVVKGKGTLQYDQGSQAYVAT